MRYGPLLVTVAVLCGEAAAAPPTESSAATAVVGKSEKKPELAGIGVALEVKKGACYVVHVLNDTPAAAEGTIKAGDKVTAVAEGEGEPRNLAGMELVDVVALIRGPVGTEVHLTILPAGEDKHRVVRFVRGSIEELVLWGKPLPLGSRVPPAAFKHVSSGEIITLDSLAGKRVVLKFWATNCAGCLHELDKAYGSSPEPTEDTQTAHVMLVSVDKNFQDAQEAVTNRGWTGGIFVWGGQDAVKKFRLRAIPCTVSIDTEGRLASCVINAAYDAQPAAG